MNCRVADERARAVGVFTLRKFKAEDIDPRTGRLRDGAVPREERVVGRNLILEEGNDELLKLLIGDDTAIPFWREDPGAPGVDVCHIGVGISDEAPVRSQTGLIGADPFYKALEPDYPQITAHTCVWRALFLDGEAEFAWKEATVANGDSNDAVNLGRCVFDVVETKQVDDVWQLDYQLQVF